MSKKSVTGPAPHRSLSKLARIRAYLHHPDRGSVTGLLDEDVLDAERLDLLGDRLNALLSEYHGSWEPWHSGLLRENQPSLVTQPSRARRAASEIVLTT